MMIRFAVTTPTMTAHAYALWLVATIILLSVESTQSNPTAYSEWVTIPLAPEPVGLDSPRTNCPHLESGLVNWADAGLGPALEGADVSLPPNTRILVDATISTRIGLLTVPSGSALIIGENPTTGVELDMNGMIVHGELIAGSETCRIETPITITLHGSRPANVVTNIPPPEVKGIAVKGGTLSLHGKRFFRTWTRLSQSAEAGDTVLVLQDKINWWPGQEIVLVTTAMKDAKDWHQNEVLTIAEVFNTTSAIPIPLNVSGNIPVTSGIRVASGLSYRHVGIDSYQAEVALLSRTIKIQGAADDSEPTDPDPLDCTAPFPLNIETGSTSVPCPNKDLTGYGAHVRIEQGGVGFVEGVELYRVGQTNVKGRYPMHFHLLGECPTCYFKDSSVHRSYYRCVAIHGTHQTTVTENVAYDVTGYCYYLEDGVELENTISFNLAAHIHMILPGPPPAGQGQRIRPIYVQSENLTLPADVTASGYYITTLDNHIIGNVASGGWAGFAVPLLPTPVGDSRDSKYNPLGAHGLTFDGNTAHSNGWYFRESGGFYFGGTLWYDNGVFSYNAGRDFDGSRWRKPCEFSLDPAALLSGNCQGRDHRWIRVTNTKAYLIPGVALSSWNGRMEVIGLETHDSGRPINAIESGLWIDSVLAVCRTGEPIALPPNAMATKVTGDGFVWYDTEQEHVMTNATFRQCGYRSSEYDQYNNRTDRGCGDDAFIGCRNTSTVFGLLSFSDRHSPELMQGTSTITYENCGRRFQLRYDKFNVTDPPVANSGRIQNWFDMDGSVSGLGEETLIGSGLPECGLWWKVDDRVVDDTHGPLTFLRKSDGPERGLAHIHLDWDNDLRQQFKAGEICGNGDLQPCPAVGFIRHRGPRFSADQGLPVTGNADIAGLAGGYGWFLQLDAGAPRKLVITLIEVDPDTPLLLSIPYPIGTKFHIKAAAPIWCNAYHILDWKHTCNEKFHQVKSIQQVREELGNTYHISSNGVMTMRIIQSPTDFTGNPHWIKPTWDTPDRHGDWYALDRFERKGVRVPRFGARAEVDLGFAQLQTGVRIEVHAHFCDGSVVDNLLNILGPLKGAGAYCGGTIPTSTAIDEVCPDGFVQASYDKCCDMNDPNTCVFANGQSSVSR